MWDRGEDVGFRHVYLSFLLVPQADTFIQEKTAMSMKKTMKLMSWNVGKPSKDMLLAYYPKIKDENVDVLALQEVVPDTIQHIKERLSEIGLDYIETSCDLAVGLDIQTGPHKNGAVTDGVLIASRWPLELIPKFFEKIPWQKSALSTIVTTPYGEIELHTVHVPNASSSGRWEEEPGGDWNYMSKSEKTSKEIKRRGRELKVNTFNGIHDALSIASEKHRILCGDFNSPKEERNNGTTRYFGSRKEHRQSEERVLSGLAGYNLADTYIKLCGYTSIKHNGYEGPQYSHVNNNPRTPRRRFDHIFSSDSLNPTKCGYLHSFLDEGLSDHAPVYAVYKPKLR